MIWALGTPGVWLLGEQYGLGKQAPQRVVIPQGEPRGILRFSPIMNVCLLAVGAQSSGLAYRPGRTDPVIT